MHRSTWKRAEQRAAKPFGGRRVPMSGALAPESGLPKADMMGGLLSVFFPTNDVKHRATWSVQRWIRELRRESNPPGQWLLVLGTPRMRGQFAVLPLARLAEFVQPIGAEPLRQTGSQGVPLPSGAGESAPPRSRAALREEGLE